MKNKKNVAIAMSAVSVLGAVAPVFADEIVGKLRTEFNLDELRSEDNKIRIQAEKDLDVTTKHLEKLAAAVDSNQNKLYTIEQTDEVETLSNGIKRVITTIEITNNSDIHDENAKVFRFYQTQLDQDFGNDIEVQEVTVDFNYDEDASLKLGRMIYDMNKNASKIFTKTIEHADGYTVEVYLHGQVEQDNEIHIGRIRILDHSKNKAKKVINVSASNDFRGHWAEKEIVDAMINGIIDNSTTFNPQKDITRAEFTKIACNAFGLNAVEFDAVDKTESKFSDVSRYEWYAGYVEALANAGYVTGDGDGTFRPDDKITRQESAVIIAKLHANKGKVANPTNVIEETTTDINGNRVHKDTKTGFADDASIAVWADESVEYLRVQGISNGYANEEEGKSPVYLPTNQIKRAEALVMMTRDMAQQPLN